MEARLVKLLLIFILLSAALLPVSSSAQGVLPESKEADFIVVMDPGHGGFDPGARGQYSTEKDIALGIGLKTGKMIATIPGVKVVYTRTTDIVPGNKKTKGDGLRYRADFANQSKGNVFISIHVNAAKNRSAEGTEVYVWGLDKNADKDLALRENAALKDDPEYQALFESSGSAVNAIFWNTVRQSYMEQSLTLAADVEKQFSKLNRIDRDVKQRQVGIWVLQATAMPSILIETGFITNPKEEKYLNEKQDEIANSIYRAFVNYLSGLKGITATELLYPQKSKEETEEKPKAAASSKDTLYNLYSYKLQLVASQKKISLNDRRFAGIPAPIERTEATVDQKRIYRYIQGDYKTYQNAVEELKNVKNRGFTDAFIVTYKGGKRLDY